MQQLMGDADGPNPDNSYLQITSDTFTALLADFPSLHCPPPLDQLVKRFVIHHIPTIGLAHQLLPAHRDYPLNGSILSAKSF